MRREKVNLRWLVLLLLRLAAAISGGAASAASPRYELLGLRCGSGPLMSKTLLTAAAPALSDICAVSFTVGTADLRPVAGNMDEADVVVVVEHSPLPVPSARGSTVLITTPVAPGIKYCLFKV
jgi:hypothetical protein